MGPLPIARLCTPPLPLWDGSGRLIVVRCYLADGPVTRAVGLLGSGGERAGCALWLADCRAVHTIGLRGAIACLFVDRDGAVVRVIPRLGPGRLVRCRAASAVVELAPSAAVGLDVGMVLRRGEDRCGSR